MEPCENVDAFRHQDRKKEPENANKNTQNTEPTADGHRCYKLAGACVLLVCLLLMIAITVLGIKYSILISEKAKLLTRHKEMTLENDYLKERNKNLTIKQEELQSKLDYLDTLEEQKWIPYNSSLYYISEMKSWNESKEDCRTRGGHLVIINNWEEENFINNRLGKRQAWIGLSDIETEGEWKWVDNTPLTTGFWRGGEPNGNRGENCVEVYEPEGQYSWADQLCSQKAPWICEKKRN